MEPRLHARNTLPVNSGVQHGCHFGQPCSRAVFTCAGSHYTRVHGPSTRPVNSDMCVPSTHVHGPCWRKA